MKYLAPIPKQFVDQSGLPLSNGAVHVYISGDTQYANVYQDADGEELMPNPARLDSNGAWLGFVTAGVPLDYVVEDKDGNVQFEYEKVVAGSGTANVAIEPVLTSGTKIAECWVDGELLELFAPEDSYTANLPIKIASGVITNNGTGLTCTGDNAWAEGKSNEATGDYSHAEGQLCKAKGQASHAGGQSCETSGQNSFAHGAYLKTSNQSSCQAAFGMYNSDQKAMFVIGNGTADNNRKDAFKVDSNGEAWVMIGGVLTKITSLGGGSGIPIYPTLQDAITNQANLQVDTIFETNGFHTSGDGGAARYKVSSTGTANGMDIVQLAAGKLAVLQVGDWIIPEQLGYEQSYSRNDVVPYIQRAIDIGCQHVHLRSSGNGAGYTWKTKLTLTTRGFKLTGEGDWGYPNKFSYIVFRPVDNTVDCMVDLKISACEFKNLDIEVTGDYVKLVDGFKSTSTNSDNNRFWYFENVRMNSFARCWNFTEAYKWHITFTNCLANSSKIGVRIHESSNLLFYFQNCYFSNCEECDVVLDGNIYTCTFDSCNFGISRKAVKFSVNASNYHYQNVSFTGCSFEYDAQDVNYGDSIFDFDDDIDQNISVNNCSFTLMKNSWTSVPANQRGIKLGNKTNLMLKSCTLLGDADELQVPWTPKILWNENSTPTSGSITLLGENFQIELPDSLVPYALFKGQSSSGKVLETLADGSIDANDFVAAEDGLTKTAYISSWHGAQNLPTDNNQNGIITCYVTKTTSEGWLAFQRFFSNLGRIYIRTGTYNGSVWSWGAWKKILPDA